METIFNPIKEYFKEVVPLGNLHILELKESSEILAIFLSLDSKNFNEFWQSETLQKLCEKYCKTLSFKGILQVQYTLLLNIQKSFLSTPKEMQNLLEKTLENLEILKQNNLAQNTSLPLFESYFRNLLAREVEENQPATQDSTPKSKTQELIQALLRDFLGESLKQLHAHKESLAGVLQHFKHLEPLMLRLDSLLQKAQTQHFSIGITGVLSSGKSTLLNALLGEEILGSSNIPETANLTLLKYAKTPSAQIFFWNKQEWEDLASTMEESTLNVLLRNEEFCAILQEKVQDSTQSLTIRLEELPKYTSANHPSKICNLIKETILFTPLEFLENNVEIVDTPGLDDPVIQREEVTRGYLAKCDLLIHAMNAAQSATQIDMEFILQALQNANLSRILILLTHADLLEEKDLQSALAYAKESIKANFANHLSSTDANLLFRRLDFIPIASYPALLCKTNPTKAKELGYSLEDSNFDALIAYLQRTLLGSNSTKAKDLIYLCAQGFRRVFEEIQSAIALEKSLLFAQEEEILQHIQRAKEESLQSRQKLESAKTSLESTKTQLQEYLNTLQKQIQHKLQDAQNLLNERIFEDIIYEYEHNKIPTQERLEYLLDLSLKDILSDILRFCAQSLSKKIAQLQEQFTEHLHELKEGVALQGFNLYFNPTLLQKTKLKILHKIVKSAQSFNKNHTHELKNALELDFKESLSEFVAMLLQESHNLESKLILNFQDILDSIQTQLQDHLRSKEQSLQNALESLSISTEEKREREKVFLECERILGLGLESFKQLQHQATGGQDA